MLTVHFHRRNRTCIRDRYVQPSRAPHASHQHPGKASKRRNSTASASGSPSAAPSPSVTSSSVTEDHGEPASKPVKEKRKRSRVSPEQLAALEGIFAIDRSPTAARRKDISVQLGMDERQTQVWFQNRFVSLLSLQCTP